MLLDLRNNTTKRTYLYEGLQCCIDNVVRSMLKTIFSDSNDSTHPSTINHLGMVWYRVVWCGAVWRIPDIFNYVIK